MLTQRSQVRNWFIESKTKAYIQRKVGWSDPESGSGIKRGGALPVKYSKYFGAKRRGFIKIKSVLAPKGVILLLNENIRYDIIDEKSFIKLAPSGLGSSLSKRRPPSWVTRSTPAVFVFAGTIFFYSSLVVEQIKLERLFLGLML